MGMYTELVLKAQVRSDIPFEVEAILQNLFNGEEMPSVLPDHPFFSCPRWTMIGSYSSYYHTPFSLSRYADGYIFSRSDLKNYSDEIEKFIDWITPYLNIYGESNCIGWKWYEEADAPTLLFVNHDQS